MKRVHRYTVVFVMLSLAILCYVIGLRSGMLLFILSGMLFEFAFWFGLLKERPSSNSNKESNT